MEERKAQKRKPVSIDSRNDRNQVTGKIVVIFGLFGNIVNKLFNILVGCNGILSVI